MRYSRWTLRPSAPSPHYRLHAEEAAVLVDLDVPLPERVVGLHQRGRLVNSGIVDQAMQAAELLGGFDGAGPIGFRGHIVPDEGRRRPELGSQRLALIVQHVADHHLRTLRYQQAGLRGTLAARPAAHEHHLVVEACHVRSPRLPKEVWQIGCWVTKGVRWRCRRKGCWKSWAAPPVR